MSNTEIVQRVSSIATCDVKDLAQVLAEALEKVSRFEGLSSKLMRLEGVLKFREWTFSNDYSKNYLLSDNSEQRIEQKLIEITGGMTSAELDAELDKYSGPRKFWDEKGWRRLKFLSSKKFKTLRDSCDKEITELKFIINSEVTEIENSAVMLIPPDYRYSLAIETMLRFVRNLRASTWKECADLYEEQLYRWKMEENSVENLRLKQEIRNLTGTAAKGAKAAAIFSGLNLLLK